MVVSLTDTMRASARLNVTVLLASIVSKFVPVMDTAASGVPMPGLIPVIVGVVAASVTVKGEALVADPSGVVTTIGPDTAPGGTTTTIRVGIALITVAGTPLKVTAPALILVPWIVTEVPTVPCLGVNSIIERADGLSRSIESRLPTTS
jgi:hypothetical protein